MSVRIAGLTGATLEHAPTVCHTCMWWQSRTGGRERDKQRWIEKAETEFGAWGTIYYDDDGRRALGSMQYGAARLFPRAAELPAGPPSDDAVLVTCAYLVDRSSPWVLQSLFLAAIAEAKDKGAAALEAFAYRYPEGESDYERFLVHRTVFPHDFLADFGFRAIRSAGPVELARLELGGLVPVLEGKRAKVLRALKEALLPEPRAAAPTALSLRVGGRPGGAQRRGRRHEQPDRLPGGELELRHQGLVGRVGDRNRDVTVGMEPDRDRPQLLRLCPGEQLDGPVVDGGDPDVDEVDVGLLGQHAGDVVLEAEAQPHQRLAEELALLLLLERLVELLVRDQALAQQQRAQVRAGLVLEKGVVQACRPHVRRYRDFRPAA